MGRNDDLSLILAKAKLNGFFPDVKNEELDYIQQYARTLFGDDAVSNYLYGKNTRPGTRVAYLGDSITQQSWQASSGFQGSCFPLFAGLLSGGQVLTVGNAGIGGNTSAQMLARFDTDVPLYTPNAVMLTAGRNDISQSVPLATYAANIKAIIAKIRAIGAVPILGTVPPVNTAGSQQTNTVLFNTWIKQYAANQGIAVVDFYKLLVDPTNANYLSTYNSDGTHPSVAGAIAMGQLVATKLAAILPPTEPTLSMDNVDASQLFGTNAVLLTDTNADGVPDSWFAYGGSSGFAHALVTDAQVPGKMMQITQTANASIRSIQRAFTGFSPGDTVAIAGRITSDGGVSAQVKSTFTSGAGNAQALNFTGAVTRGVFYQEYVVPVGTTSIMVDVIAGTGTGVVSWGQITPINLTTLGSML